jgi:hypothetical protein
LLIQIKNKNMFNDRKKDYRMSKKIFMSLKIIAVSLISSCQTITPGDGPGKAVNPDEIEYGIGKIKAQSGLLLKFAPVNYSSNNPFTVYIYDQNGNITPPFPNFSLGVDFPYLSLATGILGRAITGVSFPMTDNVYLLNFSIPTLSVNTQFSVTNYAPNLSQTNLRIGYYYQEGYDALTEMGAEYNWIQKMRTETNVNVSLFSQIPQELIPENTASDWRTLQGFVQSRKMELGLGSQSIMLLSINTITTGIGSGEDVFGSTNFPGGQGGRFSAVYTGKIISRYPAQTGQRFAMGRVILHELAHSFLVRAFFPHNGGHSDHYSHSAEVKPRENGNGHCLLEPSVPLNSTNTSLFNTFCNYHRVLLNHYSKTIPQ